MNLSGAVEWWSEWQLRILALGSLGAQFLLAFLSRKRKSRIPPWWRFLIWLSYLACDALAIYSLAALFNRRTKLQPNPMRGDNHLVMLWIPILLMHLGGLVMITAYNIEDNELWKRHVVIVLSQVVVALYVFIKSWSSSDYKISVGAILVLILAIFRCFTKPWSLRRASFKSLISTFDRASKTTPASEDRLVFQFLNLLDQENITQQRTMNPDTETVLQAYVRVAKEFIHQNHPPALENPNQSVHFKYFCSTENLGNLFVDITYPYSQRLAHLQSFWLLNEEDHYLFIQNGLSNMFNRLYSKDSEGFILHSLVATLFGIAFNIFLISAFFVLHKDGYSPSYVLITFVLLNGTLLLDSSHGCRTAVLLESWEGTVCQHNLVGFFARNKRQNWVMSSARLLNQDMVDQYWCMEPCDSTRVITELVQNCVKTWWKDCIRDADSYRKVNDFNGEWTLECEGCEQLVWSLDNPFDENILTWHLATDFCLHFKGTSAEPGCVNRCIEISNYMVYLMFSNPEMLMPGCRKSLLKIANNELEDIFEREELPADRERIMQVIIEKVESRDCFIKQREELPAETETGIEKIIQVFIGKVESRRYGFIKDAWLLAQGLMGLGDDEKMWRVIRGVWVEMLCFSASRCRGFLHAKSLGSGGEYLSYVWLLLAHAGMETFSDKLQRRQHRSLNERQGQGDAAAGPSTSEGKDLIEVEKNAGGPSDSKVMDPLQEDENSTTPLASQGKDPIEVEKNVAGPSDSKGKAPLQEEENSATQSTTLGDGEGTDPVPDPEIEIVISP